MNANSAAAFSLFTFVTKEFCYTTTREENVQFSFMTFFILLFLSQLLKKEPIDDHITDDNGGSVTDDRIRDNSSNACNNANGSTSLALANLAHNKNLVVEHVTSKTAASIQNELCRNNGAELTRLVQGRLTPTFVYDFFSCVAGKYLKNSSLLRGQVPSGLQYLPGGNFYWSNLHIYVVRNSFVKRGRSRSIQGLCVFHDAYLSSYPGPNNFFHTVDPVLTKNLIQIKTWERRKKNYHNLGEEFNDATTKDEAACNGRGSRAWCDIPVLAGPGVGRVVLAHCLETRCKELDRVKFFVRVSGGENNVRMLSLLLRFGFNRLYLSHPLSKEPWLDEAGEELFVMSRKGPIGSALASKLLKYGDAAAASRRKSRAEMRSKSKSKSKKKSTKTSKPRAPSRRRRKTQR